MSLTGTTAYLIFRSAFPFIKEVLLEDKGLKELLLGNKPALLLALCLLFVFVLLADTTGQVGELVDKNKKLTSDNGVLVQTVAEQKTRITTLEESLRHSTCVPGPEADLPPPKSPGTGGKTNLRSYVENRLRHLER